MRHPTLDEFHAALRSPEGYRTAEDGRPWPPRRCRGAWITLRFHLSGMVRTAIRGGIRALFHRLTPRAWAEVGHNMLTDVEALGARCRFEDFARLQEHPGPRVFVANHMSLVETIILPPALMAFGPVSVVAKRSLAKYPLFGSALKASRPTLVSRENARQDLRDVLEQGGELLRDGRGILLFPQSTRSLVFQPKQFNSLGVKLAQKAGVPVTPIALCTDIVPPGKAAWRRDFGPVDLSREMRFRCGPDFDPAGMSAAGALDASRDFIAATLSSWGLPTGE